MTGGLAASGDRSVAAGGNIGKVVTGDFSTLVERGVVLPAEALAVPETGLVHLPDRTALFVGREKELALLDEGPWPGVRVLCGLGGIGKSTLAAHWAAGRLDGHHPVWWITAETPAELDAGLAALARAMHPTAVGVLPDDALRERALQWLATHDDWLLILDNVSDPADLKPLLARGARGRVLVTSRRASGWQDVGRTVALDVLDPEEAAGLFAQVCGSDDGVDELCAELGYLPLALRQAAAYCAEAGITPRAYGELLAAYPAAMFAATEEGGEEARTVARVWQVTLERLADTPLAVVVLRIVSWWGPEGIPRRLLALLGTPVEVTEAVRRLAAHSMITLHGETLGVHRLVQALVREQEPGEGRDACGVAVALLRCGVTDSAVDLNRRTVVHVEAFAEHTDPAEDDWAAAELFLDAGEQLRIDLAFGRAVVLLERALGSLRRTRGPHHTLTVRTWQGLAMALVPAGDPVRAAEVIEQGIADRTEAMGPDDPEILLMRGHRARMLLSTDPEGARLLMAENVAHCERVLGPLHPLTIRARFQLLNVGVDGAGAFGELLSDAERAVPEAVDLCDEIEHSLIMALVVSGEPERALARAEGAVERHIARYGAEDPRTLLARWVVLRALNGGGRTDRARELGAVLLEDCLRVLGETEMARLVRTQLGQPLPPVPPPAIMNP
ncbi:NB-ARC domain-containing protein [Streptomyces sp. NPDC056144]|uniref:NB-ARC domain-containing protein n=1 Tax=unclassified Streptomyces TaxID=2593676 RepID=UPI0035DF7792